MEGNKSIRIFTDLLFVYFESKFILNKEFIMKSLRKWLTNLFEGMAFALVQPMKNSLPPEIGTHSYRDKPFKGHRSLWYS